MISIEINESTNIAYLRNEKQILKFENISNVKNDGKTIYSYGWCKKYDKYGWFGKTHTGIVWYQFEGEKAVEFGDIKNNGLYVPRGFHIHCGDLRFNY